MGQVGLVLLRIRRVSTWIARFGFYLIAITDNDDQEGQAPASDAAS
jgi:hypothetical protein